MYTFNPFNNDFKEPTIVEAKFIISPERKYSLEFDQNINMQELKLMIAKASHLRPNNFRLFCEGIEYTQYNQETFESLFHEKKFVVFSINVISNEEKDQTELLLQMNCPCDIHISKFLIYYCFTCGKSICCDCFTIGEHKGHQIQDKCFYLLSTKFLVDKLFENLNQIPYEEYKDKENKDFAELSMNARTIIIEKIICSLKDVHDKIQNIIEQYHNANNKLLDIIRNSTRNIKVFYIKLLDDLKEKMNIKDILSNEQIFLDFDKAYKKLKILHKNRFHANYTLYQEFSKQIPDLINNLLNDIRNKLFLIVEQIYNDKSYDNILNQIQLKTVIDFNQEDISKEINIDIKNKYDDYTQKRLTLNYKYNDDYDNKNINGEKQGKKTVGLFEMVSNNLNNGKQKIQNNTLFSFGNNSVNNINNSINCGINVSINENKENDEIFNYNINNKINNNMINNNNVKIKIPSINNKITNNLEEPQVINKTTVKLIEKKIDGIPSENISTGHIESNIIINKKKKKEELYSSAQESRQMMNINSSLEKLNNSLINSENQNFRPKINIYDDISNESLCSLSSINQIVEENIKSNDYNTNLNNQKEYNIENNNQINKETISQYIHNINDNYIDKYTQSQKEIEDLSSRYGINSIQEEVTESEYEINSNRLINNLIKKEYILAPISQTNFIKLITSDKDEIKIPLQFPNTLNFNSFLLDCSYCNSNKLLYITGGINSNEETNYTLSIDLSEKENRINILSPMNYKRSSHSMISYYRYLFAIGGKNQSSAERFNIIENIWENLSPMNYKRMFPILVIYDDYLYGLFGKRNDNEFCNNIERIRLDNKMEQQKWEMVQFNNPQNIDTRIYGSAVFILNENLLLFGGKVNEKKTNKIHWFDFDTNTLREDNFNLGDYCSFKENRIYQMKNGLNIQINDDFTGIFFKF